MFDIGALELLVVVIVAIIVIGPKDMPQALRMAGRWVGKIRRMSAQFRSGFDAMVREAELEDMEKQWKERNAKIMADTPEAAMEPLAASAESAVPPAKPDEGKDSAEVTASGEPENLLPDPSTEPKPADDQGKA